ncbi:MAG TPA: sugar ABC transporter permease [Trueperaceae bacterium]|nr:sugar ABC transporter permease [Trueperaceae bacterium]
MDPSTVARLHNLYWSIGTVAFIILGSALVGLLARRVTAVRGGSLLTQRRAFWGYAMASPWLLGFVIFVLGPSLASLYYSLTDYRLGQAIEWSGLDNYRTLLGGLGAHGRRFMQAMYNSFYYAIVGVPLQIATSLIMALLVARALPGISLFRLVFYLPVILAGGPAILLAWRYMLASNGGFINVTLKGFADAFTPFDWLYRTFIFLTETFNAFYSGVIRNDPVGPLMYLLPAALAAGLCVILAALRDPALRKGVAATAAEILVALVALALLRLALLDEVGVHPGLISGVGMLAWLGATRMEPGRSRRSALVITALLAAAVPIIAAFGGSPAGPYVLPAVLVAVPSLAALLVGRPGLALGIGAAANALFLLVRLVPGQLDEGKLATFGSLVTLRSALRDPGTLDYLRTGFAAHAPSPLWLLALLALIATAVAAGWLNRGGTRAVLLGGAGLFGLLTLGSLFDGIAYFRQYDVIASATGAVNHHFALFRQVTAQFPDSTRVPLWLGNELWSKPSLILITMWSSGGGMLIFLAALKGVPGVFYEAAEVDGATAWQRFWRITLPMISPAMFYNVVIGMIAALQTFEAVYIIQNTQTEQSIASAAYFLFVRTFRQLEIGQGAAASWILAVIIVVLTIAQFRYSRWVHYS